MTKAKRRTLVEREKVLAQVERKVLIGHDTPGKLLSEMPELRSRGTAQRYLAAVFARWEELGRPDCLDKARYALIGNTMRMRETAWKEVEGCQSAAAKAQFLRLVDKAIEREIKLRGMEAPSDETSESGARRASRIDWDELSDEEIGDRLAELERELGIGESADPEGVSPGPH